MALIFASLWSWWDLVWHSLAHAREPTTTPRVKPITFSGEQADLRGKRIQFCSTPPSAFPPLFFLSPFFSLLIYSYDPEV